MKLKLKIPVIILLIFYSNSLAQEVQKSGSINLNAPETLILTSGRVKDLETSYRNTDAKEIINRADYICSKSIIDTSNYGFDAMMDETGKISVPDNDLAVWSSINNEYMLEISFNELSFRLLNAIQKHQENLFNYLPSTEKMASIPIFSTTNSDIARMKTLLVRRQIWILTLSEKREEKNRCWLAIKRMLDEIDIPKSESGDAVVQRSPYGIIISSGEIIKKLKLLSENETDEVIKAYSAGLIKEIESAGPKYLASLTEISVNDLEGFNPLKNTINEKAMEAFNKALKSIRNDEKITMYTSAIKIDSNFTAAYFNRGMCFYTEENYNAASEDFRKVVELDQGYSSAYKYLGNCSYKTGKTGEAVKEFTEALKDDVSDTLFLCRGLCYQKLGQYRHAAMDFSSAIKLNPKFLDALKNRVKCFITLKQFDDAEKDYRKLIIMEPKNSTNYYNLGYVYSIKKDWERVIKVWEEGLRVNPQDKNIQKNLPAAKANLIRQKTKN